MGHAMAQSFLISKGVGDAYTEAEAFFLGGIIMCCDEHHGRDFVSLVRHNSGFVSTKQLSEHRSAVSKLANMAGGRVTDLDSRKFDGFAVHFSSRTDSETSLINRANSILEDGEVGVRSALLSGIFDGRSSFDRREGAAATTQFVVDCPRNFEELVSDLVVKLGRQFGIQINTNFSRDRLSGGNPRRTQLRMKSSDAERFFAQVGLVSPAKMERAREIYGAKGLREKDAAALPGVLLIDKYVARKSGSYTASTSVKPKPNEKPRNKRPAVTVPTFNNKADTVVSTNAAPKQPTVSQEQLDSLQIGTRVSRRTFGDGSVVNLDSSYVEVAFDSDDKRKKPSRKFMFPGAFHQGLLQIG